MSKISINELAPGFRDTIIGMKNIKSPFATLLNKKSGKVIWVGDSIASGVCSTNWNDSSANPLIFTDSDGISYYESNRFNGGYVRRFDYWLSQNYPSINLRNIAIRGKGAKWYRDRKDLIFTEAADVYVIALGTNDRFQTNNYTEFIKYLNEIIDKCLSLNPNAEICLICSPHCTLKGEFPALDYIKYSMFEINKAIRKVSEDRNLYLVDFYTEVLNYMNTNRISEDVLFNPEDGIHPIDSLYELMWNILQKHTGIEDKVGYLQDSYIYVDMGNTETKRFYSKGLNDNPFQKIGDTMTFLASKPTNSQYKILIDNTKSYTTEGVISLKNANLIIDVKDKTKPLVVDGFNIVNSDIIFNCDITCRINGFTNNNGTVNINGKLLVNETAAKQGLVNISGKTIVGNFEIEKNSNDILRIDKGEVEILNISRYELNNTGRITVADGAILKISSFNLSKLKGDTRTINGIINYTDTIDVKLNRTGITKSTSADNFPDNKISYVHYSANDNGGWGSGGTMVIDKSYGVSSNLTIRKFIPEYNGNVNYNDYSIILNWWNPSSKSWTADFKVNNGDYVMGNITSVTADLNNFKKNGEIYNGIEVTKPNTTNYGLDLANMVGQGLYPKGDPKNNNFRGMVIHNYTDAEPLLIDNVGEMPSVFIRNARNPQRRKDKPSNFIPTANFLDFRQGYMNVDAQGNELDTHTFVPMFSMDYLGNLAWRNNRADVQPIKLQSISESLSASSMYNFVIGSYYDTRYLLNLEYGRNKSALKVSMDTSGNTQISTTSNGVRLTSFKGNTIVESMEGDIVLQTNNTASVRKNSINYPLTMLTQTKPETSTSTGVTGEIYANKDEVGICYSSDKWVKLYPTSTIDSDFVKVNNSLEIINKEVSSYKNDMIPLDIKVTKNREHTIGTSYTLSTIPFTNADGSINAVKKEFSSGGFNTTELPRNGAIRQKSILALNASALHGSITSGGKILGHQIKNGVIFSDTISNGTEWTLGVKADGTIKSYKNTLYTAQQLLDDGVINSFCFSIPIIQNGVEVSKSIYTDYPDYNIKAPRQVIGQKADKTLLILTSEGRRNNEAGFTLPEVAKIMLDMGCIEAYNLDGGGSAQTIWNGVMVNTPVDMVQGCVERATPDIMFFAKPIAEKKQDQNSRVLTLLEKKLLDFINEVKIFGTNFITQNLAKTFIKSPHATNNIIEMDSKGYDDLNVGIQLSQNGKIWGKLGLTKSSIRYANYNEDGTSTQIFRAMDNGDIDTVNGTLGNNFKHTKVLSDVHLIDSSGYYWTNANTINAPFNGEPAMVLAIGSIPLKYMRLEAWRWKSNQKAYCYYDANGWSAWTSY